MYISNLSPNPPPRISARGAQTNPDRDPAKKQAMLNVHDVIPQNLKLCARLAPWRRVSVAVGPAFAAQSAGSFRGDAKQNDAKRGEGGQPWPKQFAINMRMGRE